MLVDTHCHLDAEVFQDNLDALIEENLHHGVSWMLTQGTTIPSSRITVKIAEKYPSVYAAVGIHPNCILEDLEGYADEEYSDGKCAEGKYSEENCQKLLRYIQEIAASSEKVVALGETGLDDYWKNVPMNIQVKFFQEHLWLSRQLNLPVIIHCRESEAELLRVMEEEVGGNGPVRSVIHSFSGNSEFLERCLSLGCYISYSGSLTYKNRKYDALRETVQMVPEERLLLETDAPYLIPTQVRKTAKINQPFLARYTAEIIAELRCQPVEDILRVTKQNAECLFRIKK
ncbi:MAG: TatD family hydrolase [Planctomycetia bacterium]|nr:TatD family hydrolase [Planctomycetia bacterium]